MPVINRIADFTADMTAWRRDLHAHPETAFEERRTAGPDRALVHNPHYDFNDEILALSASYRARLAETVLEE